MMHTLMRAAALLSIVAIPAAAAVPASPVIAPRVVVAPVRLDTAVFAGGCFWGVQAVFQHVKGVVSATSGYAGGSVTNPGYERVSTGTTGHAESVRVVFDPATVSYETLLDVFFSVVHDPTELNRQGPDVGTQYRSAIFFTSPAQQRAAARVVSALGKSGRYRKPIVTQIATLESFYRAESYHQNYATAHPDEPYIRYNDAPKIEALRARYPLLWKDALSGS